MKESELGINFGDMVDMSQMIDTEAGEIIAPVINEEDKAAIAAKEKEAKKDLIEVNLDDDSLDDPNKDKSSDGEDVIVDDKQSSSSLPNLKVLANALHEQGVLSELDASKLESADSSEAEILISLIKGEIDKNVSSYKSGLPEKVQKIIENYEDNVPLDVIIGLESTKTRLESISEEALKADPELQKIVISENLKRLGMSEGRIAKRLQQFGDLDQLQEESIEALTESKDFIASSIEAEKEQAKLATKTAEKTREDNLKSLREDIDSATEFIDGIKITKKEKDVIYDSMTKPVDKDINGNPMNTVMVTRAKNPLGFEKLLHYYHSLGLFNIDDEGKITPDISKIKTGAKVSMMDELNSALTKQQSDSSGTPARETTVDRSKMKTNIENMKGLFK